MSEGGSKENMLSKLPKAAGNIPEVKADWLINGSAYKAGVYRTENRDEIVLSNGLISRTFRLAPNAATVGFDNLMTDEAMLRGVKPEAILEIDGVVYEVGGLKGQPNYAFLLPEWIDELEADPDAFRFVMFEVGKPEERFAWQRVRHHAPNAKWPPEGVYLRMDYEKLLKSDRRTSQKKCIRVSVHYELYDGIPCLSKWITVHNSTERSITLNRFTSENLAVVEYESMVEPRGIPFKEPNIHVETDYAFGGGTAVSANKHSVHWVPDPDYDTQVNYDRKTPCLLEVRPTFGPEQDIGSGKTFESFRAFLLPYDSYGRERRGLALRRMYRTVAPWVTENPMMMHVRYADWETVKNAIDQCAEVGFEMVALTFGSGFDVENESEDYLAQMKKYADYARSKGIEIGGYSLLSSRQIGDGNDIVSPPGEKPAHGNCPALTSPWGQNYFRKMKQLFDRTGFRLLEHDGSYPGDRDITPRPPLQKGEKDSQWVQWKIITDFYKYCRENGIYLNVPDYYYLSGSNKCGMGYRESNWSLPRAQQVIHTRQNIYDGAWQKTPSMGWMFVPLTEYHGGGAEATVEPLDRHRKHYEQILASNLAMGVQACYRGRRLYDTDNTKELVKRWVEWFKTYRHILESDIIHGRRADGRDIDWMLHVNPDLKNRGMLVVFNPLGHEVKKTLKVPLYYTGLTEEVKVSERGGPQKTLNLSRDYVVDLVVVVPARDMTWYVLE